MPISIVTTWYSDPDDTPKFDNTDAPFDFSYPSDVESFRGSTGGQPLGALGWHNLFIIASDRTSSISLGVSALDADFDKSGRVDFYNFVLFAQRFGETV